MSEISRLSIGHFLRGAVFTTFCHQKVVPKVSARRKAAGNSQRLAKTGACRGFASKPAPFFNARRCSFLFPHFSQCGDCCALRATMILISFYSVLAGLRPAGSHCENGENRRPYFTAERIFRKKTHVRPGVPAALLRISIKSRKSDGKNR